MAGGIDWFRWHHGSVTDPKFALVARRAGASLPDVLAVWAYLLEHASAADSRGTFESIDFEAWDCLFGYPDGRTQAIYDAMCARQLIAEGAVSSWEKRQPKRERESDNSTERSRNFRQRQKQEQNAMQRQEGECNAMQRQETPREEKRREEIKEEEPSVLGAQPSVETRHQGVPDCPHQAILALWAEVLPHLPQHTEWNAIRRKHLQARWREKAVEKGWKTQGEGTAFFRKLFVYVGQSPWLTGRVISRDPSRQTFVIELEWLIKPTNFAKVIEGKYHQERAA